MKAVELGGPKGLHFRALGLVRLSIMIDPIFQLLGPADLFPYVINALTLGSPPIGKNTLCTIPGKETVLAVR